MFTIRFEIVDEGSILPTLTPSEFDEGNYNIYGGFELRLGEPGRGLEATVSRNPPGEVIREEMILTWLEHLLDSLPLLQGADRIFLSVLEMPRSFLRIERDGESLSVSRVVFQPPREISSEGYSEPLISRDSHQYVLYRKGTTEATRETAEVVSVEWGPLRIELAEYREGVLGAAKEFLGVVESMYPGIWNAKAIQELRKKVVSLDRNAA